MTKQNKYPTFEGFKKFKKGRSILEVDSREDSLLNTLYVLWFFSAGILVGVLI